MKYLSTMTDTQFTKAKCKAGIPENFHLLRDYYPHNKTTVSIPTFTNFKGQFYTIHNNIVLLHASVELKDQYLKTILGS